MWPFRFGRRHAGRQTLRSSDSSPQAGRRAQGAQRTFEQLEDRILLAADVVYYHVNAGGPTISDAPDWIADNNGSPFTNAGAASSETFSTGLAIDMSDVSIPVNTPVALFQTERWDSTSGQEMQWNFALDPGLYEVRLYFSENYSGAQSVGARVFDVSIEGQTVLDNYDVFADVGAFKGVVKSFTIASDANLDIDFGHVTENPAIKAIEIRGTETGPTTNGPPVLASIANQTLTAGTSKIVPISALDPNGDPLTLSAANLPSWASFTDNGNGTGSLTLNPEASVSGPTNVTITAADNGSPVLSDGQVVQITVDPPVVEDPPVSSGTVVHRVNSGGPALAGTPGWLADNGSTYTNGSAASSDTAGNSVAINMSHASIPAGTPAALFQTERWDGGSGQEMQWNFAVDPGTYVVRLYFAETYSGTQSVGARVFDVSIEGQLVLDNYDVFADVGGYAGVVKSFTVASDGNIDIDFGHVTENPAIKAIEIIAAAQDNHLSASASSLAFADTLIGNTPTKTLTLTNTGATGDPSISINKSDLEITGANAILFSATMAGPATITLAPGESATVTVGFTATDAASKQAVLSIPHSGDNSPLTVDLSGSGVATVPIGFGKSSLAGEISSQPTSLQFGPDGRLYVAQQNGLIQIYTIERNGENDYSVTATQTITSVQQIPNHDDDGQLDPSVNTRLVTGLLVTGTAANPVLYVTSSDPRIGAGPSGTDLNLDTNSGILSRLTWNGSSWTKVDLVRGLSRSEENHASNGMALDQATNTLYIAQGGNTNMGAPSNNFADLPEYALSAAILSVDLDAIGNSTYDLPTLDDEDRIGVNDANDPFGGNNGKNQAILVPGGPVQVYSPGFRNPYDVVLTSQGRLYTIDNGPNSGWGNVPVGEGPGGNATNDPNEPGSTHGDALHFISSEGYYGGHPNPTRSNPSNTFNASNPQSPVSEGNPIESDYLIPGVEDGSPVVYGASTNGLAEYTASNFQGSMKGDLLAASFDDSIKRVKLDGQGDDVVLAENLFNSVGSVPLDVVAVGDDGPFPGTIWVADIGNGAIIVFEPNDYEGNLGGSGTAGDADGDGYSDDDELANGTNPNSAADFPADWDGDFVSNLLDPNDDNDSQLDNEDPYAIDPLNGQSTPVGVFYSWENDAPNPGGLLNLGFTGLMTNGVDDYESLYDAGAVTAGGAAGVFTIDSANSGTAHGATNTQEQAYQFGVNLASETGPVTAKTSVLGPFSGLTPQAGQEMGMFIGTGDQDNYVQIVLSGDGGGSVQVMQEINGVYTPLASDNLTLPGPGFVELWLTVDPIANTVQAIYSVDGAEPIEVGSPVAVPAAWLNGTMAVGLISTNPPNTPMPVTWDYLGVERDEVPPTADAAARLNFFTNGNINTSSNFTSNSFQVINQSTGDLMITSVTIDVSTTLLPDMAYDPFGGVGDLVGKDFTPDGGTAATGQTSHSFGGAVDGDFRTLTVNFNDFDPGETFSFSVDTDPTSIKGSAAPAIENPDSISGLEVSGATITVQFSDGSFLTGKPFAVDGSDVNAYAILQSEMPLAPMLSLVDVPTTPTTLTDPAQTVRISGSTGATVRLMHTESALLLAGVPGGGYDVEPYESNKVIAVTHSTHTIGAGGFVDVPVTLTDSHTSGGINQFMAVVEGSGDLTSTTSNVLVVELGDPPPPEPDVEELPISYRVNAGGPPLAGSPGWEADNGLTYTNGPAASSDTASSSTAINLSHASIPAGTPAALFQTERWDATGGQEMQWNFGLVPGTYEVRLYFAETYSGAQSIGGRVFDVSIEGQTVLDNYDVFADVGANAGVVKSFTVTSDSNLDIDFGHVTENPAIKAIEILQAGPVVNVAPVLAPINDQSVPEGVSFAVPVTATDSNGDPITLNPTNLPAWASFADNGNGTGLLTLSPGPSTAGDYSITITATDDGDPALADSQTVILSVIELVTFDNVEYRVNAGGPTIADWVSDAASTQSAAAVDEAISIGSRLELFIDDELIDTLVGADLELHSPDLATPSSNPLAAGGYPSIIYDGTLYHHYYRDYVAGANPAGAEGTNSEVYRYEYSTDGVNWIKPVLNIYNVNVNGPNNVVLAGVAPSMHNFMPFLDTNPNVAPQHKFKAIAGVSNVSSSVAGLRVFSSPDGMHWSLYSPSPVITLADTPGSDSFAFDSSNIAFWSELEQKYVVYYRTWSGGSTSGLRMISRAESTDFVNWTNHVDVTANLAGEHLYASAINPYFRSPSIYVGIPTQFLPNNNAHNTRILLMSSRDGLTFDRTFGQQGFIEGLDGNRQNYAAPILVPTANDELSIYTNSGQHYTMRLDGFASIDTTGTSGQMITKPLAFVGDALEINYQTGAGGSIRVELLDSAGQPLPGFSLADSELISGDEIAHTVQWNGSSDLSSLASQVIRVRMVMTDADVYAMQFDGLENVALPPQLVVSKNITAAAGATVTVPVQLKTSGGLGVAVDSVSVALSFDAARFSVANVRAAAALAGYTVNGQVNNTLGTMTVTATGSGATLSGNMLSSLVLADFTVKPGSAPGSSAINLLSSLGSTTTELNGGATPLAPAPTSAANDSSDGKLFVSGTFFNAAAASSTASTSASINTSHASIPAGTPAALFQTERWDGTSGQELQWTFAAAPGTYEVRLYFAETYSGAQSVGGRVFDVFIEDQLVLDNYDVFADVGANTGVVKSFVVTSDGALDIDFAHVTENPSIKAIEIRS